MRRKKQVLFKLPGICLCKEMLTLNSQCHSVLISSVLNNYQYYCFFSIFWYSYISDIRESFIFDKNAQRSRSNHNFSFWLLRSFSQLPHASPFNGPHLWTTKTSIYKSDGCATFTITCTHFSERSGKYLCVFLD